MNRTIKRWGLAASAGVILAGTAACGSASEGNQIGAPEECTPAQSVETVEDGILTVAIAENPPVAITSDGRFEGLEPTLIREFAEANCLALQVDSMSFAATIPAVESGRADMAAGGYYRTAERAKVVDLTAPIWLDQMGIIAESAIETVSDLEGSKVGTVDGYLWVPELQAVLGSDLTIYPSSVEMKADLEAGRIEAAVDSVALAQQYDGYVAVPAEPDERVQSTVQPAQVGWPYAKGNTSLGTALDEAIAGWHSDGTIADALEANDLPAELGETGEPRLIQ
jgi:polar amino acid transport system substrate-binding protein